MADHKDITPQPIKILISGPRGSGLTTLRHALKRQLDALGYSVKTKRRKETGKTVIDLDSNIPIEIIEI